MHEAVFLEYVTSLYSSIDIFTLQDRNGHLMATWLVLLQILFVHLFISGVSHLKYSQKGLVNLKPSSYYYISEKNTD